MSDTSNSDRSPVKSLKSEISNRFGDDFAEQFLPSDIGWVWETDAEHRFSWFSESFEEVTGISRFLMLGKSRIEFLDAQQRDDVRTVGHLHELKAHKPFKDFLYHSQADATHPRWLVVSGNPRHDEHGNFLGYVGIGRDVTHLFEVRSSLEELREELDEKSEIIRSICEHLDVGLIVVDPNDKLVIANSKQREIYGLDASKVAAGTPLQSYLELLYDAGHRIAGSDLTRDEQVQALLAQYREPETKAEVVLADGRIIQMMNNRLPNGYLVGIRRDISEIKKDRRKLASSESENAVFREILDNVEVAIYAKDKDLRLTYANKAWAELSGVSFEDARGKTDEDFFGEQSSEMMSVDRKVFETGESIETDEVLIKSNGKPQHLIARKKLLTAADGQQQLIGTTSDVSALRDAARMNELFERILETLNVAVYAKTEDLRLCYANEAWAASTGHCKSESMGKTDADIFGDTGLAFMEDDRAVMESGIGREFSGPMTRADGTTAHGVAYKDTVTTSDGTRFVIGSTTDVSHVHELRTDMEAIISHMEMGVVLVDRDLNCLIINEAFHRLHDSKPEDFGTNPQFRDLIEVNRKTGFYDVGNENWEAYVAERLAAIQSGDCPPVERETKNGKTFIYTVKELAAGKRLVTYFDITERIDRERALEQANKRTRLAQEVLNSIDQAIVVKDKNHINVFANKAYADTLNATVSEVENVAASEHFDGELSELFEEQERQIFESGETITFEENRDGISRLVNKSLVTTEDGESYVAITLTNITGIKDREAALQEAVERTKLSEEVLNSLDQGILVKDSDLNIIFANRKFADLHDANIDDFMGKRASAYFGKEAEFFEGSECETLATGKVIEIQEDYEEDGEQRSRLVFKSRVETDSGRPYVAITLTDVTEIRNRERALEEAEKKAQLSDRAKSEFLANMSHEIRTPMNGVLGMAELLAKSELDSRQKTFTDIIVKSGNALLTIINDILDFSKIDAGQLVLDPAPFNLRESIEDVATLVSAKAKEKDLEMIARVAPDLPDTFIGDVGRFRQIITNLMGNAVKFTEQGHVLVDVSGEQIEGGYRLHCKITDTGIGIPQDKVDTIFEKFSQVDTSATRRHEGTGLGLAITSKLVDMMGGKIGVESSVGEGSTFWFAIDLPVEKGASRKRKTIPVDVSGARVLIIDDNPVNREILMEQMTSWAFDAFAVESGPKGLAMLKQAARLGKPVDLAIVDYQMPDMTGDEVIRHIRGDQVICDLPIVVLTSVDQALQPMTLKELNIEHHLLKPARSSHLLECIVGALQSRIDENAGGGSEADQIDAEALAWLSGAGDAPVAKAASVELDAEPQLEARTVQKSSNNIEPVPGEQVKNLLDDPPALKAESKVDVLIAEDNEVNQLVYGQIFAQLDYTYKMVDNGQKAVEAARDLNPNIILMDVSMPVMNGIEATEHIRKDVSADVPIIGVTAHALKGDREKCMEAGMSDYLPKPISPDRLEEKLANWWPKSGSAKAAG
ncbi:MAG: PAS domain-containing protein [Pseudomonadota bacterium]